MLVVFLCKSQFFLVVGRKIPVGREQLLPVKRQHKEVMQKLYALTRSAEYALSDSVPFEASSMYFELSEKITEFELEDELYKE